MLKYLYITILVLIPALWCAEYQIDGESNAMCDCVLDINVIKTFLEEQKAVQLKLDNIIERIKHIKLPTTCAEATETTGKSGIYTIQIKNYKEAFLVQCVNHTDGKVWTVIQSHIDANTDFHRNWTDYKIGFGDIEHSFWMGLDKLYALTTNCEHELLIVMQDYNGTEYYARYDKFAIADESRSYELVLLGKYTGNAGDSLTQHIGRKFSTRDRDNDGAENSNCAKDYTGGWWYDSCYYSHLNGNYTERYSADGVVWVTIKKEYSLKSSKMLIRPKGNC